MLKRSESCYEIDPDVVSEALGGILEADMGHNPGDNMLGELAITKALLLGASLDGGRWEYNGDHGPNRKTMARRAVCFLLSHGLTIEP